MVAIRIFTTIAPLGNDFLHKASRPPFGVDNVSSVDGKSQDIHIEPNKTTMKPPLNSHKTTMKFH